MDIFLVLVIFLAISPLSLLMVFILILFIVVLMLAIVLDNYLFSYLVYLLFMSGLIVLFMYFCSIILSEKYIVSSDLIILSVYLALSSLMKGYLWSWNSSWVTESKQVYFEFYNLLKYLVYSYSVFSLFFVSYLLICLVIIYEIVIRCKGPLRMKT